MNIKSELTALIVNMLSQHAVKAHNTPWTNGIACIIYSHCTSCYNYNGIAPFSLMSYIGGLSRLSMAASVQAGSMPPVPASRENRKYAHSNTLSDHEIDETGDWVNNFAPLGIANKISSRIFPKDAHTTF